MEDTPGITGKFQTEHDKQIDADFYAQLIDFLGQPGGVQAAANQYTQQGPGGHEISPLFSSLLYLSEQEHVCRGSLATSYFTLADQLLGYESRGLSGSGGMNFGVTRELMRNTTKTFILLGESQVHSCRGNLTVYHHLRSEWGYFAALARVEQRRVFGTIWTGPGFLSEGYIPPPPNPRQNAAKWNAKDSAAITAANAAKAAPPVASSKSVDPDTFYCLNAAASGNEDLVHVAVSADRAQIDGIGATLRSFFVSTKRKARLCLHVFLLKREMRYVQAGLKCSFGPAFTRDKTAKTTIPGSDTILTSAGEKSGPKTPRLFWLGDSGPEALKSQFDPSGGLEMAKFEQKLPILFHEIDPDLVIGSDQSASSRRFKLGGDVDVTKGFTRDTGNLQSLHNFVRFFLHDLLAGTGIKRIIYLDADVIVKRDVRELWEDHSKSLEQSRSTVCAAIRPSSPLFNYIPGVLQPYMPEWVPLNNPAFNAGVLLIDLEKWRNRGLTDEYLMWLAARDSTGPETLWRHGSQPLMLLLFHAEACKLESRWNVDGLGHRLNYPSWILDNGGVYHWTGPLKPWLEDGVNRRLWEPYAGRYCPRFSRRLHTQTCRPDSWQC